MKILILPNPKKTLTKDLVVKLCDFLKKEPCELFCTRKHSYLFPDFVTCIENRETALELCDVVIAIGGDGTVIRAAKLAAAHNKAVLGINAGHFGFTASLEADEIDLLKKLFSGDYSTRSGMLLSVVCKDSSGKTKAQFNAINEVLLQKDISCSLVDIFMQHNKLDAMDFRGDGIIISTPIGSTGYSLSAGGPVVDPSIECFIASPICAHTISVRSTVFSADSYLEITVRNSSESACSGGGICTLLSDGEIICRVDAGDSIHIKKSDNYAKLINLKNISFANKFLNKFGK